MKKALKKLISVLCLLKFGEVAYIWVLEIRGKD